MDPAKNVFGEPLESCSEDPLTGFFRDGCCNTADEDFGRHTVCTRVTREFLEFSRSCGNDLSTPREEFGFPGLLPGDQWCLCAARWQEALEAGAAPRVGPARDARRDPRDRRLRGFEAFRDRPLVGPVARRASMSDDGVGLRPAVRGRRPRVAAVNAAGTAARRRAAGGETR